MQHRNLRTRARQVARVLFVESTEFLLCWFGTMNRFQASRDRCLQSDDHHERQHHGYVETRCSNAHLLVFKVVLEREDKSVVE